MVGLVLVVLRSIEIRQTNAHNKVSPSVLKQIYFDTLTAHLSCFRTTVKNVDLEIGISVSKTILNKLKTLFVAKPRSQGLSSNRPLASEGG